MNESPPAQGHAVRKVIMNHQGTLELPPTAGLNLINTALRKLGLEACISSRITTVIHVVKDHQINDNCYNEPFAVSQCRRIYT